MSSLGLMRAVVSVFSRHAVVGALMVAVPLSFVASVGLAPAALAAPKVPYSDPDAAGFLGICNQHGQQITSGNIDTKPFAWEVVSSVAAPSSVSGKGRTATLYAYQPIQNLASGYWSGEQITGSSQYSNPSSPMAVSTNRDLPLSQFLNVFPPKWDGFIELRVYLDSPGVEPDVMNYPALNLSISGDTWQAVGGGSVDCTAGQAVSDEALLPTTTTTSAGTASAETATGSPTTSHKGGKAGTSSGAGSSPSAGGRPHKGSPRSSEVRGDGSSGHADAVAVLRSSTSSNATPLIAGAGAAALLVAISTGFVVRARRRRTPS